MKSLWITALAKDKVGVQELITTASKYGLEANGHFWEDNLKKMAWLAVKEQLMSKNISLWVILLSKEALTPDTRYGLTLLTLSIQAQRPDLPILLIDPAAQCKKEELPGVFAPLTLIQGEGAAIGVKFASMANIPAKKTTTDFYLAVHANPGFGVWFEVGPTEEEWQGGLLGVNGGEIKAHGVGERGILPQRCVLKYPIENMKLESGTDQYLAWGVGNTLNAEQSYFIKVDGLVTSLIYGRLPDQDQADLHCLKI